MTQPQSIFRVALLPDGTLEVEDWRGNTHICREADIGTTIRRVLADPELPPVERIGAGGYNFAEAYARLVIPEQYHQLVRPAANMIHRLLENAMKGGNGASAQRAEQYHQQQQNPRPPPDPPRYPPRDAHRRGHRVA